MSTFRAFLVFVFFMLFVLFADARIFSFFGLVPNVIFVIGFAISFALLEYGYGRLFTVLALSGYSFFFFFYWLIYFQQILVTIFLLLIFVFFLRITTRYVFLDLCLAVSFGTTSLVLVFSIMGFGQFDFFSVIQELLINSIFAIVFYVLFSSCIPRAYAPSGGRIVV